MNRRPGRRCLMNCILWNLVLARYPYLYAIRSSLSGGTPATGRILLTWMRYKKMRPRRAKPNSKPIIFLKAVQEGDLDKNKSKIDQLEGDPNINSGNFKSKLWNEIGTNLNQQNCSQIVLGFTIQTSHSGGRPALNPSSSSCWFWSTRFLAFLG